MLILILLRPMWFHVGASTFDFVKNSAKIKRRRKKMLLKFDCDVNWHFCWLWKFSYKFFVILKWREKREKIEFSNETLNLLFSPIKFWLSTHFLWWKFYLIISFYRRKSISEWEKFELRIRKSFFREPLRCFKIASF